jgi:hypothetical protein
LLAAKHQKHPVRITPSVTGQISDNTPTREAKRTFSIRAALSSADIDAKVFLHKSTHRRTAATAADEHDFSLNTNANEHNTTSLLCTSFVVEFANHWRRYISGHIPPQRKYIAEKMNKYRRIAGRFATAQYCAHVFNARLREH